MPKQQPSNREILQQIAELRAEADRLMQQASTLAEKAAKLEDLLARSQNSSS